MDHAIDLMVLKHPFHLIRVRRIDLIERRFDVCNLMQLIQDLQLKIDQIVRYDHGMIVLNKLHDCMAANKATATDY
jgi:hypothetical protein